MKKQWYEIKASADAAELHLFGEVGWEISAAQLKWDLERYQNSKLRVFVNSIGGSVVEGIAVYNMLLAHPGGVEVIVNGIAASIASVIAMAGKPLKMNKASFLMVHNPHGVFGGGAEDARKAAEVMDTMAVVMAEVYATRPNVSVEQATAWMNEEKWFTASEALAAGMCDEIIEGEADDETMARLAASLDLSKYSHVPEVLRTAKGTAAQAVENNAARAALDGVKKMDEEAIKAAAARAAKEAVDAAIAAERNRVVAIEASFAANPGFDELRTQCLVGSVSIEDANAKLLAAISARQQATPSGGFIRVTEDARDKFIAGASLAVWARSNPGDRKADNTANEFRGFSLMELAREAVTLAGISTRGMSRLDIVGSAFTLGNSAFTTILRDAANKSLMAGWDAQEEIYARAARIVSIADFKTMYAAGLGAFSDLDKIGPSQTYQFGDIGEHGQSMTLATYGKLFNITRQAIINDDLMAFTDVPRNMGIAARRKIGDLFAAAITSNPLMDEDGLALFKLAHNNTIAAAAPSTAQADAMAVLMGKQTAKSGTGAQAGTQYLNLAPKLWLVPRAYYGQALQVVQSTTEIGASKANPAASNYVSQYGFEVLADSRFDADSATKHYMTVAPSTGWGMMLGLLDGNDAPALEQESLWMVDGTSFKVRVDAVAAPGNYRGFVRSTIAAD